MLKTVMLNLSVNFEYKINDKKTEVFEKGKRSNVNWKKVFVQI